MITQKSIRLSAQVSDNHFAFGQRSDRLDVNRILAHTEKMLAAGQDKNKEERIIRARYILSLFISSDQKTNTVQSPSKAGLNEYIGSIKRLQRARDQMSSSNMKVQQQAIGDLNELLDEGSIKLQDQFRSRISERLQPVEPLHFITKRMTLRHDYFTHANGLQKYLFQFSLRTGLHSFLQWKRP